MKKLLLAVQAAAQKIRNLNKNQKIVLLVICLFALFDIVFFTVLRVRGNLSSVLISFDDSSFSPQHVLACNAPSRSGSFSSSTAYFTFSAEQRERLRTYYEHFGSVGINVRVGVKNARKSAFSRAQAAQKLFTYGFLFDSDFDKKGKLAPKEERILSGCDVRRFIKDKGGWSYFSNELAIEKNLSSSELPCGIVISSDWKVRVFDFFVTRAKIGYDFSGEIPFYGLPSNGGSFGSDSKSWDFSGAALVFPVENSAYSVMPVVELGFSAIESYGEPNSPERVRLNAGGDTLTIRRAPDVSECKLQTSTLISPFSSYDIPENAEQVQKLLMRANDSSLIPAAPNKVIVPLKTDPGVILTAKAACWRAKDYEVYEWDRFPGVLFFDTADYAVQARFFRRLAFFAEKTGFRGSILTDEQLGDMHGYNAHDYGAQSLASFFTKAVSMPGVLNDEELLLRDILVRNGVIVPDGYAYAPGSGAVISISRESTAALRQTFLSHESWHGIFFINEEFRNAVAALYYTVDANTMAFIKGYWKSQPGLGYDPDDEFLMKNEFMAYIMQQPLRGVADYFVHLANRGSVMKAMPDLCAWVRQNRGITFEDAGKYLDSYAFDNWGLACGRVALITR